MADMFIGGKRVQPEASSRGAAENVAQKAQVGSDTAKISEELAIRPFREYFGISSIDSEANEKLLYVIKFLKEGKDLKYEDMLRKIRHLDMMIGGEGLGEKKIDKIYRFVRVLRNVRELLLGEI